MKNNDHELIQSILSGDKDAFTILVRKYQKQVHALVWRKTGDFHVAEEITQDTFLRAYSKLATLKNPNLFAGWLYVIANRLCNTWFQKRKPKMRSLDAMPQSQVEELFYSKYLEEQREELNSEKQVDLVKRLLKKLPESERIVITLHYLAGSSTKEISEFLGVSLNTVKSRLHRARKRLQKEDNMISETLGSFQSTTALTENIMKIINESGVKIDPAVPVRSKPFLPWSIAISSVILVVVMLGLGTQNLARFQQPYSLDATSPMSVDIVDASVMMNLPSDPDVRNQVGNIDAPDKSNGTNQNPDTNLSSYTSGKIIDEKGKPVDNVNVAIFPVKDGRGAWFPITIGAETSIHDGLQAFPAEINRGGNFTINDYNQGVVLLGVLPFYRPENSIIKVQIGELYLFPNKMPFRSSGIVLKPNNGKDIANVEITVREQKQNRGYTRQNSSSNSSSPHYISQRRTGSLTGRVVDKNGNPVTNLPVYIGPYIIDTEEYFLTSFLPDILPNIQRTQTDEDGQFTLSGVTTAPQYFAALPYNINKRLPKDFETIVTQFNKRANQLPFHRLKPYIKEFQSYGFGTILYDYEPDVEIVSLQINEITFYPRTDFDDIPFGIVPGKHIKDIVVTVQPRTQIQGRVLFNDGTPLTKDRINLSYKYGVNSPGGLSTREKLWVDADGYFVHYMNQKDVTYFYKFTIEYQGLKVTSNTVQIAPGQRYDNLTFRFNSPPISQK